ncbi:MAG: hypothetical protein BWK79_19085 [Beggiatoa sp. IS2]|nr:MAG: hypothetical protein BWK79_19085 [Beggiatoa sp. IS2]
MFATIADIIIYQWSGFSAASHLGNALHFFVEDVLKIFSLLVIIIYFIGLFRSALNPVTIRDYLRNRSQALARTLAVTLGAVTPFCSCSSVPLFIGFVEAGIPLSITFSFLIASPMINEVAVVLLIGILGWKLTLLYVMSGLTVAYVGGMVMERCRLERWVEDYVWKIQMGQVVQPTIAVSLQERHQFAVEQVTDIVRRIWLWVLLGVGVGALFHGYAPQALVENLSQQYPILAVPMAVILGIPLYSNAIGVIPIAEAMLTKGVAVGTTLAFMMSIVTLSLPELLILRKVIRWQGLAVFVLILAVAITLVGWTFNLLS